VYTLTCPTKLYQKKGRSTVPAVRGLDLVISGGEWLAVQGRTGHGKSTLLNLLGDLGRPAEGTVELDGTDLGGLRENQPTRLRADRRRARLGRPRRPVRAPARGAVRRPAAGAGDSPGRAAAPAGCRGRQANRGGPRLGGAARL
jgi:energy-coupling factor transporter ATP-binding protein EcfA2